MEKYKWLPNWPKYWHMDAHLPPVVEEKPRTLPHLAVHWHRCQLHGFLYENKTCKFCRSVEQTYKCALWQTKACFSPVFPGDWELFWFRDFTCLGESPLLILWPSHSFPCLVLTSHHTTIFIIFFFFFIVPLPVTRPVVELCQGCLGKNKYWEKHIQCLLKVFL